MHWQKSRRVALHLLTPLLAFAAPPDIKAIISNSVHANHLDFVATPHYNYKAKEEDDGVSKTFQVTMINGSPYRRLIAVNGEPISAAQQATEHQKEADARRTRASESASARSARMAKYERGRLRDSAMMSQLTVAFTFTLDGEDTLRGHRVYVLRATPKPDYVPPNRDCEVLTGMRGKLWIDEQSFQWVQVEAEVIQPVSIGGFLATVNPGTRFELDKEPVRDGSVWFPSHFKMQANAKVLFLFSKNSSEDETFWDYQKAN